MIPGKLYKTTEEIVGRTLDEFEDMSSTGTLLGKGTVFMCVGPCYDTAQYQAVQILVGDTALFTYGRPGRGDMYRHGDGGWCERTGRQ